MSGYLKAALCAATLLCSSNAYAANFLVVDIAAQGTGTGFIGSRTASFPTRSFSFETFYASLVYNLEGSFAPQATSTGLSVVGSITDPLVLGAFSATGFNFSAVLPLRNFLTFGITGKGCYANSSPATITTGSPSVDTSCGQIAANYSDGFNVSSYSFSGAVTGINFRIVQAETRPDITFSIPEPSTWALMLAGFALTGYALRRKRATFAIA